MLPYGRHWIDEDDVSAVVDVLRGDWLTTGPSVTEFERSFAGLAGTDYAVAVSSGTAALHAMMHALGVGPGDEVIVPTMTFAGTANAVRFCGGTPIFTDIDPNTLLITPEDVEAKITGATRAIVAVDFAGQPCDYAALRKISERHKVALVSDSCHALGARYGGQPVGSLTEMSSFSFHPVKHITAGEGGMVTTKNAEFAADMRRFRNHCMSRDHHARSSQSTWEYDIDRLGFNYRLTDLQCALGNRQLQKLTAWIERRNEIAKEYDDALVEIPGVEPLAHLEGCSHAYHLYVIRIDAAKCGIDRETAFSALRAEGIGVNVHYRPVHLMSLYAKDTTRPVANCPRAETVYAEILSLPIFPRMTSADVGDVVAACRKVFVRR